MADLTPWKLKQTFRYAHLDTLKYMLGEVIRGNSPKREKMIQMLKDEIAKREASGGR